jgi:hypothetical protein
MDLPALPGGKLWFQERKILTRKDRKSRKFKTED